MAERARVHVAIISDDAPLVTGIGDLLSDEGTVVFAAANVVALGLLERMVAAADVVVLDRARAGDVADCVRHIRQGNRSCAVAVMNARTEVECVALLDEGADEACVRGSRQLASRLNALARRARTLNGHQSLRLGDVVVDRSSRRVWCAGAPVRLSSVEYQMLVCLLRRAPHAVRRATIVDELWTGRAAPKPNIVDVYVGRLRRALNASRSVTIATMRGVGYALAWSPSGHRHLVSGVARDSLAHCVTDF
jgi:DNA-binding response OmpR family regulator